MNRSTFLTSLLALPATVKALMEIDGDDIVFTETNFSDTQGAELYIDGEHVATIEDFPYELGDIEDPTPYAIVEEFDEPPFFRVVGRQNLELGENAEIYYDSSDYKLTSKGVEKK